MLVVYILPDFFFAVRRFTQKQYDNCICFSVTLLFHIVVLWGNKIYILIDRDFWTLAFGVYSLYVCQTMIEFVVLKDFLPNFYGNTKKLICIEWPYKVFLLNPW